MDTALGTIHNIDLGKGILVPDTRMPQNWWILEHFCCTSVCQKMWYLCSVESASIIQRLPILECENGLVLSDICISVSGTFKLPFFLLGLCFLFFFSVLPWPNFSPYRESHLISILCIFFSCRALLLGRFCVAMTELSPHLEKAVLLSEEHVQSKQDSAR